MATITNRQKKIRQQQRKIDGSFLLASSNVFRKQSSVEEGLASIIKDGRDRLINMEVDDGVNIMMEGIDDHEEFKRIRFEDTTYGKGQKVEHQMLFAKVLV
jgi:hypothetical protein